MAVLNEMPQQERGLMSKIGGALSGFGAGVDGQGAQFQNMVFNQNQQLSEERKVAAAKDIYNLHNRVQSGDIPGAQMLLNERLGFINDMGGDASNTQAALDQLNSGDVQGLLTNLADDVQVAASQGYLKLPVAAKSPTPIKAYNSTTGKEVFATPEEIASAQGNLVPAPDASSSPSTKVVLNSKTGRQQFATEGEIANSGGVLQPVVKDPTETDQGKRDFELFKQGIAIEKEERVEAAKGTPAAIIRGATEGQNKNAGFADVAAIGNAQLESILDVTPVADITTLSDVFLRADGDQTVNAWLQTLRDPKARSFYTAALNLSGVNLRSESGAAITIGEVRDEFVKTIPIVGDDEATLDFKRTQRAARVRNLAGNSAGLYQARLAKELESIKASGSKTGRIREATAPPKNGYNTGSRMNDGREIYVTPSGITFLVGDAMKLVKIKEGSDDYSKLPSGAVYIDPEGYRRTKS